MAEYNQLVILLENMASQANLPSLSTSGPLLPSGWVKLKQFVSSPTELATPVQGFLAKGYLDDPSRPAIILALGITWNDFYFNNSSGIPTPPADQMRLPSEIAADAPTNALVSTVFVKAYTEVRKQIWDSLTFISAYPDYPVYITGMGLGAPIAQICSLDFRRRANDPGPKPPKLLGPGYVFSAPEIANSTFASYYQALIKKGDMSAQFAVWAASPSLKVDQFPTKPEPTNYVPLGELSYIADIKIPAYDVPWWERSDVFYLQALGGTPKKSAVIPVSFSILPSGFSRDLAYTLSFFVASAYKQAQHPYSPVPVLGPYTFFKSITSNGTAFASIFTSSDTVIVAFRGTTTFEEFYGRACLSSFVTVDWFKNQTITTTQAHKGTFMLYTAPASSGKSFRDALRAELDAIAVGKKLYLAGHDMGGALANLATADYSVSSPRFSVTAVYTFGSTLLADLNFYNVFNDVVKAKSYQILRLKDKLPNAIVPLGYFGLNSPITMIGQQAIEESTYHALTNYINLLNPS